MFQGWILFYKCFFFFFFLNCAIIIFMFFFSVLSHDFEAFLLLKQDVKFLFSLQLFLTLTFSKICNRDKAEASSALKEEHRHLV